MAVHEVSITAEGFKPAVVQVKAGDKVRWVNNDTVNHWPSFEGVPMLCPSRDLTYQHEAEFSEKGEFPYYCKKHPTLTGTIAVK